MRPQATPNPSNSSTASSHSPIGCELEMITPLETLGAQIDSDTLEVDFEEIEVSAEERIAVPTWGRQQEPIFFFETKGGKKIRKTCTLPGRCWIDSYIFAKKQYVHERSFKLKNLAMSFLTDKNDFKEDPGNINQRFAGNDDDRAILASYCLQDCFACSRLMEHWSAYSQIWGNARGANITMEQFMSKENQFLVVMEFIEYGCHNKIFIPWVFVDPWPSDPNDKYLGGKVFPVVPGFHQNVLTLDFMSLYPTSEDAHNLCATTFVHPSRVAEYPAEDIEKCPKGHAYLKKHVKKGVLPILIAKGMENRNHFKKLLAQAKANKQWDLVPVYNAAQNFEKLRLNTKYGTKGARIETGGLLPFRPVAESTCMWGRYHITDVYDRITAHYGDRILVVGGDTDSLMIRLNEKNLSDEQILRIGREMLDMINVTLPAPMKLQLEALARHFISRKMKNYASSYYPLEGDRFVTKNVGEDIKIQGIEAKRLNFAPIVAESQFYLLRHFFGLPEERPEEFVLDPPPAVVLGPIRGNQSLLAGIVYYAEMIAYDKVPTEGYLVSSELRQDEYKNKPPHAIVRDRLIAKGISCPQKHERVAYGWCQVDGKRLPFALEEIRENKNLVIHRQFYLRDSYTKVMVKTFESVLGAEVIVEKIKLIQIRPDARSMFASWFTPKVKK